MKANLIVPICNFSESGCGQSISPNEPMMETRGSSNSKSVIQYRLVTVKSSTLKCDMAQIRVVTLLESASLKSETELVHLRLLSVPEIYDS